MTGNVNEWCNDGYNSTYYSSSPYYNPHSGSGDSRVWRGGSWDTSTADCRVAYGMAYNIDDSDNDLGFRVVLTPVSSVFVLGSIGLTFTGWLLHRRRML